MVTKSESDWVEVYLLNNVVKDFTKMLAEIAENTLKF